MYQEVEIGSLAHAAKGSFKIGPFGSSLKKSELVDSGIPVVGIENVLAKDFSPPFRRFITKAKFKQLDKYSVQEGDVLVTTMGTIGKAAVVPSGIGRMIIDSHLFRMRLDLSSVDPHYLCYGLNGSRDLKRQLERKSRGAIMAGLNTTILRECTIPLPPLAEQKRIAAILDKADRLRRLRRYALELSDTFLQSVFLQMFGDPVTNPKEWPTERLGLVGMLDRGRSRHRPRNAPELLDGPYPLIQTGEVANAFGYITSYTQTYSELGLSQSKMWPKGTLCITIAANIAQTAILGFDACFPDSVVGFTPSNKTGVEFIQQWFSFVQKILEATAPQVAQKNINLEILRNLDVIMPPIELQRQFSSIVSSFENLRIRQQESIRQANHLFDSLLHRAFRGEL